MAKHEEREKALLLRKRGYSYNRIRALVGVSKGTLSVWLRKFPLSKERIDALRGKNPKRIEAFRLTMLKKREEIISACLVKEGKKIGGITKRDLHIMALALYWAEGTKTWDSKTEITNSDPLLLRMFMVWLKNQNIEMKRVRVKLHLYETMDIPKEIRFWSQNLGISTGQFYAPIVKESKRALHRGSHGHGTCQLIYGSRELNDRIYAGITHLCSLIGRVE